MSKPNYSGANKVIKALIQGTNPIDGEALPNDNILNNAEVLRALLAASASLEDSMARAQRRSQLPGNVGRTWSEEEEETLIAAYNAKDPVSDIAHRHGRTIRAIEARLERLGLITASERVTNNSFVGRSEAKDGGEQE